MLGHAEALAMVREAGGDRVQVLDVENLQGRPVYVHAKLCVVDDVWAAVGSDNFNTRSWTHDSELTAAVVDSERDQRAPDRSRRARGRSPPVRSRAPSAADARTPRPRRGR